MFLLLRILLALPPSGQQMIGSEAFVKTAPSPAASAAVPRILAARWP